MDPSSRLCHPHSRAVQTNLPRAARAKRRYHPGTHDATDDRGRRPPQALRHDTRAARPRPRRQGGHHPGRAGAQRCREDDRGPDPHHADPARLRERDGGGDRRPATSRRGARQDGRGGSVRGPRRGAHRPGEPRDGWPPVPDAIGPGQGPHPRAARRVRHERGGRPGDQDLLRRHAAPPRPGRLAGRAAAGALPRRADHRARPARAASRCGT